MGKRDLSISTSVKRIQGTENHEEKISNRTEHYQGRRSTSNRHSEEHQKPIWEIDKICTIGSFKKDIHCNDAEGTTSNYPCRRDGVHPRDQGRREVDGVESGNQVTRRNKNNKDTVGRPQTSILNRFGHTGPIRDQTFCPSTGKVLQVPKIQSYSQHLPLKVRHMWPMRRPSPNKNMCRQEKRKRISRDQMPQLQGRPLHGQCAMPLPQGNYPEKDASSSSPTSPTSPTSQVSMGGQSPNTPTNISHNTQTTSKQVPDVATATINGGLPRHSIHNRKQNKDTAQATHTDVSQSTTEIASPIRTNTAEKTHALWRLEECRKKPNKRTETATITETTNPQSIRYTTYTTTRNSTVNKQPNTNHHTPTSTHQNNQTRVSYVSKGHSSDKPADHDNAATVNVPNGRHSTQPVHTQHNEGYIPEHAPDHTKVRILHWNAQGLNSKSKQSTLVAALQLDHIDIAMIQDSRISSRNDGKPPIRVPNCHTYFIPASAECHGMLTIIRNNIPSKIILPIATSEGTEMLTVKVWIDKKPTLLHNIYRVRGETSFTEILACRLPSILAGDFNAHHTLWCRYTDGPGRTLLDQIENANMYAIMNKPQVPTTQYNTTIDLTIVHTSIAAISEWAIYDDLISDHHPIILTIQTDYTSPVTVPTPRWSLHKADWESFKSKLTELCTTTKLDCSIDELTQELTGMIIQAAEYTIPKTKPHKKKRKYWCYNDEVKLAKWSINRAVKKLRSKKRSGYTNLEPFINKVREANINYKDTCNKIRNNAWDEWLTKNNTAINSKTIWQRIKRCTGTIQRPPTHPDPQLESNKLLSEFVARSSSKQLEEKDVRILQQQQHTRQQRLNEAINSPVTVIGQLRSLK